MGSKLLFAAGLVAFGVACGFFMNSWLSNSSELDLDEAPLVDGPDVSSAPNATTQELLRELIREVRLLRTSAQRSPVAPSERPATSPGEPGATNPDALMAELRHLVGSMQGSGAEPGSTVTIRETLIEKPDAERRNRLFEFLDLDHETRQRSHFLWTYAQVLDRYGVPDDVSTADSGATWYYNLSEDTLQFNFQQGRVMNVWN